MNRNTHKLRTGQVLAEICCKLDADYTLAFMTRTSDKAMQQQAPPARDAAVFVLVLAAGTASRYGSPKQLASYRGEALVSRAVRTAEQLCGDRSVLITGHAATAVHAACAPLRGFFLHNENYAQGLGTSIACGVAAVRAVADGVLLMLADQPLVSCEHLQALLKCWQEQPDCAVASRYAGSIGVPAILPAADFDALLALRGDCGAKAILAAHGKRLIAVDCAAGAVDIDRPADLATLP